MGSWPKRNAQTSPRLDAAQKDHPATRSLSDGRKLDTSEVRVRRRFRFVPPPRNEDVAALFEFDKRRNAGHRKINGPRSHHRAGNTFDVARLERTCEIAGVCRDGSGLGQLSDSATGDTAQPDAGRSDAVQLPESEHQEAFLKTPHGDQVVLTADSVSEGVVFRSNRTILPGDYVLQLGLSGDTIPFHVQRNPRESNLAALTDDDHKLLAQTAGLSTGMMDAGLRGSSHSDPVWPFLLMLLIAFMSTN